MKAIRLNEFGGTEHLSVDDIEIPAPAPDEVLIKTVASGINFADIMLRQGKYLFTPELPFTLGFEAAGTVESVGSDVSGIEVGQRVLGMMRGGGYAEFAAAPASQVFPIPDGMDFGEATALLVQGLTAVGLLRDLQPGQTILIHAAAGGVGSLLVQLAKQKGARVLGTASSPEKLEMAAGLGMDVGINYTESDWAEKVLEATEGRGADMIIEMVGGEMGSKSMECLAVKGRMIVYGAVTGEDFKISALGLLGKMQKVEGYNLNLETPANMAAFTGELMTAYGAGNLEISVVEFPLEKAVEAHQAIEGRRTTGKVVLTSNPD
ncbi:MAG: quinone oxidoreductase [Acidobacteriota bacterium]|nr:quinone oxidoreductase [Acidobacteriota bacterium]